MAKIVRVARLQNKGLHETSFSCYDFQAENIYAPPPPHPPISGHKAFFRRGGWGCIFSGPTWQEFYTPLLFIQPPTPRRVILGMGGWACINLAL